MCSYDLFVHAHVGREKGRDFGVSSYMDASLLNQDSIFRMTFDFTSLETSCLQPHLGLEEELQPPCPEIHVLTGRQHLHGMWGLWSSIHGGLGPCRWRWWCGTLDSSEPWRLNLLPSPSCPPAVVKPRGYPRLLFIDSSSPNMALYLQKWVSAWAAHKNPLANVSKTRSQSQIEGVPPASNK